MARADDAISALKTLSRHAELIVSAYLDNKGEIVDAQDSEKAIAALKRYRLVWQHDDSDDVQLSNVIHRLLDNSMHNYRRHMANEAVGELWDHLQNHLMDQYRKAKKRNLHQEIDRLSGEIQECTYELIEHLNASTSQFAQYITSGFTYISDLDLRIQENKRVINMARKLNDLLNTFDLDELYRLAGSDVLLRKLLAIQLPRSIERCQRDLVNSLHNLGDLLHSLRENVERSRLIGLFETKYANDGGFMPSIDGMAKLPAVLNQASVLILSAFGDIGDASQEEKLSNLASGLRKHKEDEVVVETITYVEDAIRQDNIEVKPDVVLLSADALISTVLETNTKFSALRVHQKLTLNCSGNIWLYALINTVEALPDEQRKFLHVEYVEDTDLIFPHNYHIRDILLSRRYA